MFIPFYRRLVCRQGLTAVRAGDKTVFCSQNQEVETYDNGYNSNKIDTETAGGTED